jgi:hypothetical protein
MKPVAYHMREDVEAKSLMYGFIAQELDEVYPSLVYRTPDAYGINYHDITAVLTMVIQQRMDQLAEVDERLNVVRDKIIKHQAPKVHRQARRVAELEEKIKKLERQTALEKAVAAEKRKLKKRRKAGAAAAKAAGGGKVVGSGSK